MKYVWLVVGLLCTSYLAIFWIYTLFGRCYLTMLLNVSHCKHHPLISSEPRKLKLHCLFPALVTSEFVQEVCFSIWLPLTPFSHFCSKCNYRKMQFIFSQSSACMVRMMTSYFVQDITILLFLLWNKCKHSMALEKKNLLGSELKLNCCV